MEITRYRMPMIIPPLRIGSLKIVMTEPWKEDKCDFAEMKYGKSIFISIATK